MHSPFFNTIGARLESIERRLSIINAERHGPVPTANEEARSPTNLEEHCLTIDLLVNAISNEVDRLYESHCLGQEVAANGNP